MKHKTLFHSVIIILTFLLAFYGNKILNNFVEVSFPTYAGSFINTKFLTCLFLSCTQAKTEVNTMTYGHNFWSLR
jgi:hypothetical protein